MDTLILCPYCLSQVDETTVFCPVCGEDTTRDAKFEMTRAEYAVEPRKTCRHCAAEMLALAVLCPTCHKKQ